MCGTWEYIAPEVLFGKTYGKQVDYWGLGCLLYELVFGVPPFRNRSLDNLRRVILKGTFVFPNCQGVSADLKHLIRCLLVVKVENRIGYKSIVEIQDHLWFKSIDWDDILMKKIKSPLEIDSYSNDQGNCRFLESSNNIANIPIEGFTYREEDNVVDYTKL